MVALRQAPFVAWLVAVWVALWGDLTPANVVGGLLVAVLVLSVFPRSGPRSFTRLRPLRILAFLGYFIVKLVESNVVVAWEIITPDNERVNEGIVAVPMISSSPSVITVVANAISLTPGTLTLEVRRDPPTLYVHVLHLRSIDAVRRDVRRLEYYALQAFAEADEAERAAGWRAADRRTTPRRIDQATEHFARGGASPDGGGRRARETDEEENR